MQFTNLLYYLFLVIKTNYHKVLRHDKANPTFTST